MAMWRCPHCATPQAEASRCWVCSRSATSCGTCRNYRLAVTGRGGYCALDRGRTPLAGDEIRGCWLDPATPTGTGGELFVLAEAGTREADRAGDAPRAASAPGGSAARAGGAERLVDAPLVRPTSRVLSGS